LFNLTFCQRASNKTALAAQFLLVQNGKQRDHIM